jgi:hypothetical protein
MYATLSGAMMAATRTHTAGPEARRPARRDAATCIPAPVRDTAPKRLLRRLKSSLTARNAAR